MIRIFLICMLLSASVFGESITFKQGGPNGETEMSPLIQGVSQAGIYFWGLGDFPFVYVKDQTGNEQRSFIIRWTEVSNSGLSVVNIDSAKVRVKTTAQPEGFFSEWISSIRVDCHEVLEDWKQVPGDTGSPSYLYRSDKIVVIAPTLWTNVGCESPTSSSSVILDSARINGDENNWYEWNVSTSLATDWVTNATNNGLVFKVAGTQAGGWWSTRQFWSHNAPLVADTPELIVFYTPLDINGVEISGTELE